MNEIYESIRYLNELNNTNMVIKSEFMNISRQNKYVANLRMQQMHIVTKTPLEGPSLTSHVCSLVRSGLAERSARHGRCLRCGRS